MRIEILRQVMISGEPVSPGSFIEVSQADGNLLVGSGKAAVAEAAVVEAPAPAPAEVEEEPKPVAAKPSRKAKTAEPLTKD